MPFDSGEVIPSSFPEIIPTTAIAGSKVACKLRSGWNKSEDKATIEDALRLRDDFLKQLEELSSTQRAKISTVVGAVDTKTGKVVVGIKKKGECFGKCAEDIAVELLGGNSSDIKITPAVRPRTNQVIPVCKRCQTKYSRDQFPDGTLFDE